LSEPRTALANAFGYYTIEGLDDGETYVVSVRSKRCHFDKPFRVVDLREDALDINFVASPQELKQRMKMNCKETAFSDSLFSF
jgi:hypothetical protein